MQIPLVSPLSPASLKKYNYKWAINCTPTITQHAKCIAKAVSEVLSANVILFKTGSVEEQKLYSHLITALTELGIKYQEANSVSTTKSLLKADANNVLLIPTPDAASVTLLLTALNPIAYRYPMRLFGHPNWDKFENMDYNLLCNLSTYITSSHFIENENSEYKLFVQKYQSIYQSYPNDYALKGFAQMYYLGNLLYKYGKNYTSHLADTEILGSKFHFTSNGNTQNSGIYILKCDNLTWIKQ